MGKEETAELKELAESDPVSAESKAAMADMLAKKMQNQKQSNDAKDAQNAELEQVANNDAVNPESKEKIQMSGAMQAKVQQARDAKEEAAELKEVAEMDAVNPESKAAM